MASVASTLARALWPNNVTEERELASLYLAELLLNVRELTHVTWAANVSEDDRKGLFRHMPLQRWIDRA